jgi:hypothetical protein
MGNQFPHEEEKSFNCITKTEVKFKMKNKYSSEDSLKLFLYLFGGLYKNESVLEPAKPPHAIDFSPGHRGIQRSAILDKWVQDPLLLVQCFGYSDQLIIIIILFLLLV